MWIKILELIVKYSIGSLIVGSWVLSQNYGMEFGEWLLCVPMTLLGVIAIFMTGPVIRIITEDEKLNNSDVKIVEDADK